MKKLRNFHVFDSDIFSSFNQITAQENSSQSICCSCLKVLEDTNALRQTAQQHDSNKQQPPSCFTPSAFNQDSRMPVYIQHRPHFVNYAPFYPHQQQPVNFQPPVNFLQQQPWQSIGAENTRWRESTSNEEAQGGESEEEGIELLRAGPSVDSVEHQQYHYFRSSVIDSSTEFEYQSVENAPVRCEECEAPEEPEQEPEDREEIVFFIAFEQN